MKRYISLVCLLLCALPIVSSAQSDSLLDRFYRDMASSCMGMDIKYGIQMPGVKVDGSGILEFQDDKWHLNGNGIEMWCDGNSVWTIDADAKEVVIDRVSNDNASELMANPAILLIRINEFFKLKETVPGKDGKSLIYIMYPKADSFVSFVNPEISKSDASLRKTEFSLDDGTSVVVNVSSVKLMKKKPADYFSRPVNYDSSWIVTDLR